MLPTLWPRIGLLQAIWLIALMVTGPASAGVHDADSEVTYKEYWISHDEFTGGCGTHETSPGSWYLEPGDCSKTLSFNIPDDFSQALKVEIYIDLWRAGESHDARFQLNGNPTVYAADVGADWSRTPFVSEIPTSELVQGTNTITFASAGAQYHIHDVAFRIYHDATHPLIAGPSSDVTPPTGGLTSITADNGIFTPADGGSLVIDSNQLTLNADASGAAYVEFHGYYEGYDEDNDGAFRDWHNIKRNGRNPGGRGTIDHIGTARSSPFQVTWQLPHIAQQPDVRFKVRLVDSSGNVREAAGGVSGTFLLSRTQQHVGTYHIAGFKDAVLHHDGAYPDTVTRTVDLPADLSDVTAAYLIGAYWRNPYIALNGSTPFPAFHSDEDSWELSLRAIPVASLLPGPNVIEYRYEGSGFGEFIEEPGPMIVLVHAGPPYPYISGIQVDVTDTTATITWNTDESANGKLDYGPTTSYENGVVSEGGSTGTNHTITLTGLMPATLYHYRLRSTDVYGNTETSADRTFTTASTDNPSGVSSDGFDATTLDTGVWTIRIHSVMVRRGPATDGLHCPYPLARRTIYGMERMMLCG